jgi:hypothetical protein
VTDCRASAVGLLSDRFFIFDGFLPAKAVGTAGAGKGRAVHPDLYEGAASHP